MRKEDINLREVIENETGNRFNKNNKISCPFHSDSTPSLSIKDNKWHCFSCGRGTDAIDFIKEFKNMDYVQACNYLGINIDDKYTIVENEIENVKKYISWCLDKIEDMKLWKLIKLYRFENIENKTLYFKAKFSTPGKKEIRYFYIDSENKVKFGRGGVEEVPYNLYKLNKALKENKPVFIVEGEKDADTLNYMGYTATSLKGIKDINIDMFKDANIYSIADTGEVGEEYQEHIYYTLKDKIKHFRVVELPNIEQLGDNADITDWFEAGHTKEEFKAAMKDSWDWKKSKLWKYIEIDSKGNYKPIKEWKNLSILLKREHITVRYNKLSKTNEVKGDFINGDLGGNAVLEDIYSLCSTKGFKCPIERLNNMLNRIGRENAYNPVQEYLNNCLKKYDGSNLYIRALAETIVTPIGYDESTKELFLTKWLLNVANIAFNDKGIYGSEGILVIQGAQGLGKTRWIKSIVPNKLWVKTGIEVDPSDKDKVYQATKYWITELGELDATLKKDQAKLKAFFTESMDEYRRPYERLTEEYPRLTAFYATVNKDEFLKDETGNRRYWTIPAIDMIVEHYIDLDQLWGEVMYKLRVEKLPYWLTEEEKDLLKKNNEDFEVKGELYLKIQDSFNWSIPKDKWIRKTATEIAEALELRNFTGLKAELKKFGITEKKSSGSRFYLTPPLQHSVTYGDYQNRKYS